MPLPVPAVGLVVSYAYLWRREHVAGRDEGLKARPCVIVLAVDQGGEGVIVTVVPVTHGQPSDPSVAIELPQAVKRHLGLDQERSWVVLDEGNRFAWPGFDLAPTARTGDRYDYGFLPPRLFRALAARFEAVWTSRQLRPTPRD